MEIFLVLLEVANSYPKRSVSTFFHKYAMASYLLFAKVLSIGTFIINLET